MEPTMRSADTPRLMGDDQLKVETVAHIFNFERSVDAELAKRIVDAINLMGGVGEKAEACYQKALDGLARQSKEVVKALAEEYERLDARHYLDRWALFQLMAELKHESALDAADRVLSSRIPQEQFVDSHSFSTVGEEVMIRTTAVEAVTRLAADGNARALEILLRHAGHENFSIKRAAIQGYLAHGGEQARTTLLKALPERDHHILDIKRVDVRQVPQAEGGRHLVCRDKETCPGTIWAATARPAARTVAASRTAIKTTAAECSSFPLTFPGATRWPPAPIPSPTSLRAATISMAA